MCDPDKGTVMDEKIPASDATDFGSPNISLEEAKEIAAAKPFPKVTEEKIKDKIAVVTYYEHKMTTGGVLTMCIIEMVNGFAVQGVSAAADPRNHDPEVGKRYAFENAFKHLWQLEGYMLREIIYRDALDREAEKVSDQF